MSGTPIAGHKAYFTFKALNLTDGYAADIGSSIGVGEDDASAIGADWKKFVQGQAEVTFSISGPWSAGTAAAELDGILWAAANGGGTGLWEWMPKGSASGNILYKGNGFLTGYDISSAIGDVVGFTLGIRGSDTPARTMAG